MNDSVFTAKLIRRVLLLCSVLTTGASKSCLLQARAQVAWDNADTSKNPATPLVWRTPVESGESVAPPVTWDKVPEPEGDDHQPSTSLVWEILDANDSKIITQPEAAPNRKFNPPSTAEEFESLRNSLPLDSSNFKPIINLSHAVPTASVLRQ